MNRAQHGLFSFCRKEVIKTKYEERLVELIDDYRDYIYFNQSYYIYSDKQFAAINATLDYICTECPLSPYPNVLDFLDNLYDIFTKLIKKEGDMFDVGQNVISDLIYTLIEGDTT